MDARWVDARQLPVANALGPARAVPPPLGVTLEWIVLPTGLRCGLVALGARRLAHRQQARAPPDGVRHTGAVTSPATPPADPVTAVVAKQDITDVLMRYCRAVDRIDAALLRSCYHPDATEDHVERLLLKCIRSAETFGTFRLTFEAIQNVHQALIRTGVLPFSPSSGETLARLMSAMAR